MPRTDEYEGEIDDDAVEERFMAEYKKRRVENVLWGNRIAFFLIGALVGGTVVHFVF